MKPTADTPIEIKDERLSDFLWIDREIRRESPNGQTWQALLQPLCVSIYVCLCGHASGEKGNPRKPRESFPSYATIARECGISRRAAIDGIATLISFGFLRKVESIKHRSNIFIIQSRDKWCVAAEQGRKTRNDKGSPRKVVNNIHHVKNDEMVNDIHHDSEYHSPLVVNTIHHDSEYHSPEVESLKKSPMKESQEEREAQKSRHDAEKTKSLALSSSPSGEAYLLFFREESKRLNQHQINAICGITDTALLKSAIEYLLKSGVQELWKKIPLIEKKMQELADAASGQAGAGTSGAASPGMFPLPGKPAATVKSLERRANLGKIAELRSSVADVIDVESRTFHVLGV